MLSTSQVSIKNALDSMLTWRSFKLNRGAPEIPHKKGDIFNIVVTPDRIPKFFIPSLDIGHVSFHIDPIEDVRSNATNGQDSENESISPKAKRSHSDLYIKKPRLLRGQSLGRKSSEDLEKVADHSDPATRAALSLPHLPKITTPYGFLTIGESPNIRRKESLFFDSDSPELLPMSSQRKMSPLVRNSSSPPMKQQGHQYTTVAPRKPSRSVSWEALCHRPKTSSFTVSQSRSTEEFPVKSEKKKFQMLLKKHLTGIKLMKTNGFTEKAPMIIGRTQSNPIA
ncbi:uncharacterized protein O3C94_004255 [Discoglossus pictus]